MSTIRGMYYLIACYYNPKHGVFLSVDPDPGDDDGLCVAMEQDNATSISGH
nr:hypothetical protein [Bacillus anthracis]